MELKATETLYWYKDPLILLGLGQSAVLTATSLTTFLSSSLSMGTGSLIIMSISFVALCLRIGWEFYEAPQEQVAAKDLTSRLLFLLPASGTRKTLAMSGVQWALDFTSYVLSITQSIPVLGMVCALLVGVIDIVKSLYAWHKAASALQALTDTPKNAPERARLIREIKLAKVQLVCAVALLAATALVLALHVAAPIAGIALCLLVLGLYVAKTRYQKHLEQRDKAQPSPARRRAPDLSAGAPTPDVGAPLPESTVTVAPKVKPAPRPRYATTSKSRLWQGGPRRRRTEEHATCRANAASRSVHAGVGGLG